MTRGGSDPGPGAANGGRPRGRVAARFAAAGLLAAALVWGGIALLTGDDEGAGPGGFGERAPSAPGGEEGPGGAGVAGGVTGQLRGAQLHSLWWSYTLDDMDRELDLLRDAGANAVRIDIAWSSLETEGKGDFASWYVEKADAFMARARERGLSVIATLWATPCWASSAPADVKQDCQGSWWDREVDRYAPASNADYADVAQWVAERWGDSLAALEIWNEPNLPDQYSLRAADPAAAYAEILKAAYPRVKRVKPSLTVLGGALAFSDRKFLERLYDLGIKGNFDALSIHPYNEWRDPDDTWKPEWKQYTFLTGVPWINALMTSKGDGDKDIWLTEFGFSTCGQGSSWCVSEAKQAEYVNDSFRIAAGWPFVKAAIAYNLRNKGPEPDDREAQFGLVNPDFTPKPGYAAFKAALGGDYDVAGAAAGATGSSGERSGSPNPQESVLDTTGKGAPLPYLAPVSAIAIARGAAVVTLSCSPESAARCVGTVELRRGASAAGGRRGGPTLGRRGFTSRKARRVRVRVKLPASARRSVRGRRTLRVTAVVRARRGGGAVVISRQTIRARAASS